MYTRNTHNLLENPGSVNTLPTIANVIWVSYKQSIIQIFAKNIITMNVYIYIGMIMYTIHVL